MSIYSWREFGRDAEYIVASYLRAKGWSVTFSPSSRGAADLVATKKDSKWCVQVKASMKSPHIKSDELERLKIFAGSVNGIPVFACVQPWENNRNASVGRYAIFLYSVDNWELLNLQL